MGTNGITKRWVPMLISCLLCGGAWGENIVFPDDAGVINLKTAYGAKADGVTDDTAALQKAVDENKGKNRTLYFPNGTYLVSGSVGIFGGKPHSSDRFLTLQGQSETAVIVKLKDNCAGFSDPAKPKTILSVYKGQGTGDVMHSYVRNLTVDAGSGNPGAVGLVFMSNNVGAMDHVTIRSTDPKGAGKIGLDLSQEQNGPCFIKRVTVTGFDTGIQTGGNFALVLEHITLKNQNVVGFNNTARTTMRDLTSVNRVTAVKNDRNDFLALIEANLTGGAADAPAITSSNPRIYLRDIKQSGYAGVVKDPSGKIVGGDSLDEWYFGKGQALFPVEIASLRLPIEETPDVPWQTDLTQWARVEPDSDAEEIQKVVDDAAKQGKTTLYFPHGTRYRITKPVRIHGPINRIIGMSSLVDVADLYEEFKKGPAVFTFEDLSSDALVVERFFLLGGWKCPAHVTMFANKSGKTIVLKDLGVAGRTKQADPGGRWFIEDVSPSRTSTLAIGKGERLWARQFNPESPKAEMIDVDGGQLWVLGLKTEGRATHLRARNQAKAEIVGGVSYQSWGNQPLDPPMVVIVDSDVSVNFGFYHYKTPFSVIVEETVNNVTRTLRRDDLKDYYLPLYRAGGKPK